MTSLSRLGWQVLGRSVRHRCRGTGAAPAVRRLSGAAATTRSRFGQPVHETHPHMLKPGELTIGISAAEYQQRRTNLALSLEPGGVAVLEAAPLQYRSGAVFHPHRQESNFLYLTGFREQDAVATIQRTGTDTSAHSFQLFVRPAGDADEQWCGPRSGLDAAVHIWGADRALDLATAPAALTDLLASAPSIYTDAVPSAKYGHKHDQNHDSDCGHGIVTGALARLDRTRPRPLPRRALAPLVNELRAIKSEAEVANMRSAGRISGRVLTEAMRRPWATEKELHAFLDHGFVTGGCDSPAYVPVVAGGDNGRIIHYVRNNDRLRDGELVLVDAGGEVGTYVTDITRTWPVSGRFTAAQRDLYQAVLTVQRRCLGLCRASAGLSLHDLDRAARDGLAVELAALGFDLGPRASGLDPLFYHHVGHHVGLDVHDVPGYTHTQAGARQLLRPGHCVTVEPGVYVPHDDRWPRHFRGMAIRIEDSVWVGLDSCIVLTAEAVKEVVDIEALRASL